jgi:hypothetical protein
VNRFSPPRKDCGPLLGTEERWRVQSIIHRPQRRRKIRGGFERIEGLEKCLMRCTSQLMLKSIEAARVICIKMKLIERR